MEFVYTLQLDCKNVGHNTIICLYQDVQETILNDSYSNVQMVLKLEMLVMDLGWCSYLGSGNQLLIAQVAGHYKIQKLCADNLD